MDEVFELHFKVVVVEAEGGENAWTEVTLVSRSSFKRVTDNNSHNTRAEHDAETHSLLFVPTQNVPDHPLRNGEDGQVCGYVEARCCHGHCTHVHAFPFFPWAPELGNGLTGEYHQEEHDGVVRRSEPDERVDDIVSARL